MRVAWENFDGFLFALVCERGYGCCYSRRIQICEEAFFETNRGEKVFFPVEFAQGFPLRR